MNNNWTNEIEEICEKLRINCVNMSEYHRRRYYHFKGYGKYFRIPIIILASINSTASVGLQPLLNQTIISGITCIIGMMMAILGSIELYMGIQNSMELELTQSKDFYTLAIELFKTLELSKDDRSENGKDYLNSQYSKYIKLCETSNLSRRKLKVDLLTSIPNKYADDISLTDKIFNNNLELNILKNKSNVSDLENNKILDTNENNNFNSDNSEILNNDIFTKV
jgi:hypothetical protein